MSRGGRLRRVEPTTTSANGIWTLNEIADYISENKWPRGPVAPTSLTASAGNAQLSLTWTAPASDGGSAIAGYIVEYTPSGGSAATVNTGSTSTSYTLTGLTNGTAYTVRVAAVNFTAGGYSDAVTATPVVATAARFTSRTISNGQTQGTPASWSGTGTVSDKLTPSQVFASATLTVGVAGTLRITGNVNTGFDDYNHYIRKNGGSSLIALTGAFAINLSVSVAAGDIIQFISDQQDRVFGETRDLGSACNIRVWIE